MTENYMSQRHFPDVAADLEAAAIEYDKVKTERAEALAALRDEVERRGAWEMIANGRDLIMLDYRLGVQRNADLGLTMIEAGEKVLKRLDDEGGE